MLADRPQEAALAALAGYRLSPSTATELTMLDVAVDNQGLERVIDTGAREVTAALVLDRRVVTAADNGVVGVWRRSDGALLGETRTGSPLIALADSESSSPVLAAADEAGGLELLDLTDPTRPRIWPLDAALPPGERLLALAFSGQGVNVFDQGADILALGAAGELLRVDVTTGQPVSRTSLRQLRGTLPWEPDDPDLRLVAARFLPEAFEDQEGLLVATEEGAVADLDLGRGQGKTVVAPGVAPGRILSLDRVPYNEPDLALGTTAGFVVPSEYEDDGYTIERGPAVNGVALGFEDGVWRADEEGVRPPGTTSYETQPAFGPAARDLSVGFAGTAAIHPGGAVSVLGAAETGLSPAEIESTPVASFAADGRLLVANGYDANHIEDITAVEPRPLAPEDDYEEDRVVKTYRPDPDWWPEAEDPDALYVNNVAGDDTHVVAGGQDPTGAAAVLVWDAETGEPLQRLSLGPGGFDPLEPSIVAGVMLLPGRDQIAAYSTAQEIVAIWSTETWELEESIPVGPVGAFALSPDESTIGLVDLGEDEEGYLEPGERTMLSFIDVGRGEVDHEVAATAVQDLAWSPDGDSLATVDEAGTLRLRSPDGREETQQPIDLEDVAEAVAWRPDGSSVAVAFSDGGVAFVDPVEGMVSSPLPHDDYSPAPGMEWSPDGSLLAVPSDEYDEGAETYVPGPVTVWSLAAARLERRMCQLAGRPATAAEWREYVDSSSQPRPLCRSARQREPVEPEIGEASRLASLDLVFQRGGFLVGADLEGNKARLGRLDRFPNPMPAFDWSEHGLAWASPGQVHVLTEGEDRPHSWPCSCAGIAWHGDEVVSLDLSGRALIGIDPERETVTASPVQGSLPYSPTLLGMVGEQAIVAAYDEEPARSTPSVLFAVAPDGAVERLPGDARGSIYRRYPSSSAQTLAFVSGASGGVCYSTTTVGIVSEEDGKVGVRFPPSPLGDDSTVVRSVQVAADSSVAAAISGDGCGEDGTPGETEPPARRYLLEGENWVPTGQLGWDVQATAEGTAVLEQSPDWGVPGALVLFSSGSREELAPQVEGLVARP